VYIKLEAFYQIIIIIIIIIISSCLIRLMLFLDKIPSKTILHQNQNKSVGMNLQQIQPQE
jgi:hypothetical protein